MYVEQDKRRGTWTVRGIDGKRKWDTFHWPTEKQADKRLLFLQTLVQKGALGIYADQPFDEAVDIFYEIRSPRFSSDEGRYSCRSTLDQLKDYFKKAPLHEIPYSKIVEYWEYVVARGCAVSTANKHLMWIGNIYKRFENWSHMAPGVIPFKVNLPEKNPVILAKEELGRKISAVHLERDRVPSSVELSKAKQWCMTNDAELWRGIQQAITTALRLGDLKKAQGTGTAQGVKGITGKTNQKFDLPILMGAPIDFRNHRNRWNKLRRYMGWMPARKGSPENPLRTTWHDLRGCGPTIMGELNFGKEVIRKFTVHATEKQLEKYINVRETVLKPAIEAVQGYVDAL